MTKFCLTPVYPVLPWDEFLKVWVKKPSLLNRQGESLTENQLKVGAYTMQRSAVRKWAQSRTNIRELLEEALITSEPQDFLFGLVAMRGHFYVWCHENSAKSGMEFCRQIDVVNNEMVREFCKRALDLGFQNTDVIKRRFEISPVSIVNTYTANTTSINGKFLLLS